MEKTYVGWKEAPFKSKQTEYTEPTNLLAPDGTLLAKGWARHNVFNYNRYHVKKQMRRKEWDFYQLSNGKYMVQLSFANISLGGYVSAVLVDLKQHKILKSVMSPFLGGKDKYVLGEINCSCVGFTSPAEFMAKIAVMVGENIVNIVSEKKA